MLLFLIGMEYYICKLADFRFPHLVMHLMDGAGQKKVCHAHVSLYGVLWGPAHCAAVHLELPDTAACAGPLPQEGGAFSGTGLQGRMRQWRVSVCLFVCFYGWMHRVKMKFTLFFPHYTKWSV